MVHMYLSVLKEPKHLLLSISEDKHFKNVI